MSPISNWHIRCKCIKLIDCMNTLRKQDVYRPSNKIPQLTLLFWLLKITATTLGETGGDYIAQTLKVGYAISTMIFFAFFLVTVTTQLFVRTYIPPLYWAVIIATSTAGTTMSDYMDRTLKLGYPLGSAILVSILILILIIWKTVEKTLSVTDIETRRGEFFYWIAILFSNTLGTALGDFLADSSGLGFGGAAAIITSVIVLIILLYYFTKIDRIILFWIAFVLTRPFGATFGDLLTKSHEKGGMDYGTKGATIILFGILVVLVIVEMVKLNKERTLRANISSNNFTPVSS